MVTAPQERTVQVPAEYGTVTRQVMVSPAQTRTTEVPAEFKTVAQQVEVEAPRAVSARTPGKMGTVRVQKMVQAPTTREIPIPARYENVERRVLVSQGQAAWSRVLCEVNVRPQVISQVQQALASAGYYNGAATGRLDQNTNAAIRRAQEARGLATGGLTYELVQSLGLNIGSLLFVRRTPPSGGVLFYPAVNSSS